MQTVITLPNGYRVEERSAVRDIQWTADRLRSARWRGRRAYVERLEGDAALWKGAVRICPYCGKEVSAYAVGDAAKLSEWEIERWSDRQLSLFGPGPKRLVIHPELQQPAQIRCPRCARISEAKTRDYRVTLCRRGNKLFIECGAMDWKLVRQLRQWEGQSGEGSFLLPLRERLTLNLSSGRTYLSAADHRGNPVFIRDITFRPDLAPASQITELLTLYPVLMRKLVRAMEQQIGQRCPFNQNEMNLRRLVFFNLFRGYPKQFYDAIPLTEELILDRSFRGTAKQLRRAADAEQLLLASELPNVKSVRRLIFTQPGLLFYLPELEALWRQLGDVNRFRSLLSDAREGFRLLAWLRQYPAVRDFLGEYIAVRGAEAALRALRQEPEELLRYGLHYAAMNPRLRLRERETWNHRDEGFSAFFRRPISYSIPEIPNGAAYRDTVTDGFTFSCLRSSAEYRQAAAALHNCLSQYRPGKDGAVLVMKQPRDADHEERLVAAIEVYGKTVIQAYGDRDTYIPEDSDVGLALRGWMWKHRYVWNEEDDSDPEDEL